MQRKLMAAMLIGAVLATAGCKNVFRAYRIDVVQGLVAIGDHPALR